MLAWTISCGPLFAAFDRQKRVNKRVPSTTKVPHLNLVYSQLLNKLLGSLPKILESPFKQESGKPRKPPANPRRKAEEPSKARVFDRFLLPVLTFPAAGAKAGIHGGVSRQVRIRLMLSRSTPIAWFVFVQGPTKLRIPPRPFQG